MTTRYRHTQVGYTLIVVLAMALAVVLGLAIGTEKPIASWAAGVVGLLLVLMSSLTTAVDDRALTVFFGPGLIRRRIPLDRIRGASG